MLTGSKIKEEIENKNIFIENFDESSLNPNSYDLHIQDKVLVYDTDQNPILDTKAINPTRSIYIPEKGLILQPGKLYLLSTKENIWSEKTSQKGNGSL